MRDQTIQREFAENGPPAVGRNLLRPDENPEGNREVQRRAALAQFRRREIDSDAPGRVLISAVADRAADPFPRILEGGIREAHEREPGQSRRHVYLDADGPAVQAVEGRREKRSKHAPKLLVAAQLRLIAGDLAARGRAPLSGATSRCHSRTYRPRASVSAYLSTDFTKSMRHFPSGESDLPTMNGAPLFSALMADRYSLMIW